MAKEAMASPSSTRYGSWRSRARSLKVPGSPSAALHTANRRPAPAWRMPVHLRPVGKPPQPAVGDHADHRVLTRGDGGGERLPATAAAVRLQRDDRFAVEQHQAQL